MGSVLVKDESKKTEMDKCKTKTKITATRLCGVKNGKVFQKKDYPYHYINNFFKLPHTGILSKTSQGERKVQRVE